jgi:hypothetical protein
LLYRALVECMGSWTKDPRCAAKPRTLGIYLDLNKCQMLSEAKDDSFPDFEHVFITELCEVIREEINRSWPQLSKDSGFFRKLFSSAEAKKAEDVRGLVAQLASVLKSGIPRLADKSAPTKTIALTKASSSTTKTGKVSTSFKEAQASYEGSMSSTDGVEHQNESEEIIKYRLTVADILRLLGQIREVAELSCIIVFIDEFSSLPEELQRRFSTLLKRIIGNHQGVFVKICAITDNYTLGSSIILQRDLFELPLDLDAFVERSGSLNAAMTGLAELTRQIVEQRFNAYLDVKTDEVFEDEKDAWQELSRAAMGVPRTLGIVLKHAWARAAISHRKRISRTDIEHGIRATSKAYFKQLEGATKDGLAVLRYVFDIWENLISRSISEKGKASGDASHFMVLVRNQERLKYLNMFFLIHLLTDGRTTKKERSPRGLYCFDYGICQENNLGFSDLAPVQRLP